LSKKSKAKENGPQYALSAATNAATAVARCRQPRPTEYAP